MGGGRAEIAAGGGWALGLSGLWRLELCPAAERRPARAPVALQDALLGLAQLALAEALSLASSFVGGPGPRKPPDFPSPPRRSFLHSLSGGCRSPRFQLRSILRPPLPRRRPCCNQCRAATRQLEPVAR